MSRVAGTWTVFGSGGSGRAGRSASRVLACVPVLGLCPTAASGLDPRRSIRQYAHDAWGAKDGLPEGSVLAIRQTRDGYIWLGTQFGLVRFDGVRFAAFSESTPGLRQHSFARDLLEGPDGTVWAGLVGGVARYAAGRFTFLDHQQGLEHPFVYALAPGPGGSLVGGDRGHGCVAARRGELHASPGLPPARTSRPGQRPGGRRRGTLWVATDGGLVSLGRTVRRYTTADGLAIPGRQRPPRGPRGPRCGRALARGSRARSATASRPTPRATVCPTTTSPPCSRTGTASSGSARGNEASIAGSGVASSRTTRSPGVTWVFWPWPKTVRARCGWARTRGWSGIGTGHSSRTGAMPGSRTSSSSTWPRGGRAGSTRWTARGRCSSSRAAALGGSRRRGRSRAVACWAWPRPPTAASGSAATSCTASATVAGPATPTREAASRSSGPTDRGCWSRRRSETGRARSGVSRTGASPRSIPRCPSSTSSSSATTGRAACGSAPAAAAWFGSDRKGTARSASATGCPTTSSTVWKRTIRAPSGSPRGEASRGSATIVSRASRSSRSCPADRRSTCSATMPVTSGSRPTTASSGSGSRARRRGRGPPGAPVRRRYTLADGLRSLEISWRCAAQARTRDGRIWYATSRGLSVVDPRAVDASLPAPPVFIEELLVGGRPVPLAATVPVGTGRERIEVRFVAPSPNAPDQIRFRYRLFGYDADWVDERDRRSAFYTNVPAGSYVFRVAARDRRRRLGIRGGRPGTQHRAALARDRAGAARRRRRRGPGPDGTRASAGAQPETAGTGPDRKGGRAHGGAAAGGGGAAPGRGDGDAAQRGPRAAGARTHGAAGERQHGPGGGHHRAPARRGRPRRREGAPFGDPAQPDGGRHHHRRRRKGRADEPRGRAVHAVDGDRGRRAAPRRGVRRSRPPDARAARGSCRASSRAPGARRSRR